jgi:hypothetical protein
MTTALTVPMNGAPPVAWDQELRGAKYLLASGLCPVALKSPEAVLFVILAGRDLGLSPVASLRGLTIIQGKIEVSADLSLGLFHRAGGKSQWEELTDSAARLRLSAPWLTASHVSSFSMADAQRAGLKDGNYTKYPKAMLRSRAITQGLKDIGFDATAGVYAPGEIGGEAVVEETTETVETFTESTGADTETIREETGEVPTEAQNSLFVKAMKSSVWTDEEREAWYLQADGATKQQMASLLDDILETGRQKKAEQMKAPKDSHPVST